MALFTFSPPTLKLKGFCSEENQINKGTNLAGLGSFEVFRVLSLTKGAKSGERGLSPSSPLS